MKDERLTQIETKLAFSEDTIAQLSELVYAQQRQIEKLETWCATLAARLSAVDDNDPGAEPDHEVPPHY